MLGLWYDPSVCLRGSFEPRRSVVSESTGGTFVRIYGAARDLPNRAITGGGATQFRFSSERVSRDCLLHVCALDAPCIRTPDANVTMLIRIRLRRKMRVVFFVRYE